MRAAMPIGTPAALLDNALNVANHLTTISDHGLGPADPRQPNDAFWAAKGDLWGIAPGDARGRLCMNCAHYFDTTPIRRAIEDGPAWDLKASNLPVTPKWADIESHPVAFCDLFDITCSPVRTCDAQEMGGPIDDIKAAALGLPLMPDAGERSEGGLAMPFEIRTADLWPDADYGLRMEQDGFTFDGYAAVFDLPSKRMAFPNIRSGAPFREIIHPGAFAKTLAERDNITLRYQHNMMALPLASTRAGTMQLSEDARGLRVRATLPDNEWGRPIRDAIARGDITGMSFRYKGVRQDWATDDAGGNVRHLIDVALDKEVSVTEFPAFPDTIATVRALAEDSEVDPDVLVTAVRALKPDARLNAEQRDALLTVINKHSDAPVIDADAAQKMARMRERLASLAG